MTQTENYSKTHQNTYGCVGAASTVLGNQPIGLAERNGAATTVACKTGGD